MFAGAWRRRGDTSRRVGAEVWGENTGPKSPAYTNCELPRVTVPPPPPRLRGPASPRRPSSSPAPAAGRARAARRWARTCKRVGAQILSLGRTTEGLAGGFEGAAAAAQEEGKRAGPWLWQGWPCGAAAGEGGEGGRRVNRHERTRVVRRANVQPRVRRVAVRADGTQQRCVRAPWLASG